MASEERVVITGVGAVSPLGLTATDLYRGLVAGRSGVRKLAWAQDPRSDVHLGAGVVGFELLDPPRPPGGQRIPRVAQFALAAAREALADSDLRSAPYESRSIATVLGVGMGGAEVMEHSFVTFRRDQNLKALEAQLLDCVTPTMVLDLVASESGATGPNMCVVSACASSAHAMGRAFELLRSGAVQAVVTGGSEAALTPFTIALFERIGTLSKHRGAPQEGARPFDQARDGFVVGEGAGILVFETLSGARRRNARLYAEVLGYGASADAFHVTRPPDDGSGMGQAMASALKAARIDPERVDYVNAHGTGTQFNDIAETAAIKAVFGEHSKRLLVSSNKSMIGHTLGAAAAVETIATAHTLMAGVVPPTLNLENPDAQCDLDYVPRVARERDVRIALKNSFGFGGQNASLILGAV
jgi:3-oxoacyl-[acyl-carrier-protein] synthase II